MEAMLFLAVIVIGIALYDTRARLKRVEQQLAERPDGPAVGAVARSMAAPAVPTAPATARRTAEPVRRGPARIVDAPPPLAAQAGTVASGAAGEAMPPLAPEAEATGADARGAEQAEAEATVQPVMSPQMPTEVRAEDPAGDMPPVTPVMATEPGLHPQTVHTAPAMEQASGASSSPSTSSPSTPASPPPSVARQRADAGQRFENLFGRQLPIWAGGITLAVAGVLLVKYSIDAGLLSPLVRCLVGLLFGAGLIGGAEAALRHDARVRDPRVGQALAGAGIATLYAAILAAANLYGLVGPATAFVGLALVTGLAMALSIRFGAPSAILGLVGGLAAPALVGEGAPNIPLLSAYLALAIGGLTALSRRQKWMWLGVSALIGGAGWGGILILTGALDFTTSLSLGVLLLLLGVALPWVAFAGPRAALLRMGAAVVAAAQIALLVAKGGFDPLVWGFYLLLSGALCWMAWRDERLRPLPPVALTIGLLLTALWPAPPMGQFTAVLLGLAVIYALPALVRLWRAGSSMIEAGQIMAVALAGHAVTYFHYHIAGGERDGVLALLALGAAALPAAGTATGWAQPGRHGQGKQRDRRFAGLVLAAALLIAGAATIGLPEWLVPVAIAAVAAGLILLGRAAQDRLVDYGAIAFLTGAVLTLALTDSTFHQLDRLSGEPDFVPIGEALLRWGAVAGAAGLIACRMTVRGVFGVAAATAALLYGTAAQLAPGWSLPIVAALGLVAMTEAGRWRPLLPVRGAQAAFVAIVLLWMVEPVGKWMSEAWLSIWGDPMVVGDVAPTGDAISCLAIPAALGLIALWRGPMLERVWIRRGVVALSSIVALVAAHSLYKQIFALQDGADLVRAGLAERTLWEALLLAVGCALWRWRGLPLAALAGAGAAVLHGLWYSQILFNPLTQPVAVGPWPILNLLIPAFAVLFAGLWVIERTLPLLQAAMGRAIAVARMILIILFAYASLRQLFCGTQLVGMPVGGLESICVSVLAIGIAIGFLLWGIRGRRHDWRIGSLILMIAAVAKVFLLDAAGLEGLLRIASFLALGFSLIGIGWLYSRFLGSGGGGGGADQT